MAADRCRPLAGRVSLVTGGDRGIGRAVALRLASMGSDVVITYRRGEAEAREVVERIKSMGVRAAAVRADLSDLSEAREVVARAREALGPVSVLVSNAGVGYAQPFEATSDELLVRQVNVDLASAFIVAREAVKDMLSLGWGRVVFVSSVAGLSGLEYLSAYSAAKAALVGLARSMAAELAPRNITVNVVAPAFVGTRLGLSYFEWLERERGVKGALERYLSRVPPRRLVTEDEVAAVVAFLASPDASGVSGAVIVVDAGATSGLGLG